MFLFKRLKLWALAFAGALGAILVAYLRGRSDAKEEQAEEILNEYVETRRKIDAADTFTAADDAREWLRNRNQ